jgi:hypothetical protein
MKNLKRTRTFMLAFLLLAGLLLVACGQQEQPSGSAGSKDSLITEAVREYLIAQGAPADDIVDLESVDDSSNCPVPAAGIAAFANSAYGYCLIYPDIYTVHQPHPNETVLVIGDPVNQSDPRVSIVIESANGRTVSQVVEGLLATFDTAVFNIESSDTTIGGEQAIMLDNMPGQDISRQLFVVHDDMLYHMMFTPFDASLTESYAQAQNLFGMVTGSFAFQTPLF